ncbi:hypothetical protein [Dokdonella sp.]|uniref:hypothetical protein n=1 Tax=Dokdonella sp. TaxID=2291710 RepID=UPI003782E6CE
MATWNRRQYPRWKRAQRGWLVRLALAALVIVLGAGSRLHAQELMPKASLEDMVAESEWVVVADLAAQQSRRNARGNLIVTDYRFHAVDVLLGLPDSDFVLTQGGGTLAGETQAISDAPRFDVGSRYLLFVRPARGELFPPFVGGAQGVYRLDPDGSAVSLGVDSSRSERTQLFERVHELLSARGSAPPRAPARSTVPPGSYPAKSYLPIALTPPQDRAATRMPGVEEALEGPAPSGQATNAVAAAAGTPQPHGGEVIDYHYEHRIAPPAVINNFPDSFAPWSPEDEYQMSRWNRYGGGVFNVYVTPTGTWAWNNDRFDLAGWPDDATMTAQFGEPWGATTLGITYSRWFGTGPIVEADLALNPAYCWTLDERAATNSADGCWGFRQTMTHELGHMWGLQHPWETQDVWWDSVMNYSPKEYRLPLLFADDTNAVRAAFGGPAIHDALLSLYTTGDNSGSMHASYSATQPWSVWVHHGDNLAASITGAFKIENLGSDDVVAPSVEFYLAQQRMSWSAYAFLGSAAYATVPVYTTWYNGLPYLPIPSTMPTGDYWFAAYLRDDVDADNGSNSAWADEGSKVHVDNVPQLLVPLTPWQTTSAGYIGPAGDWTFTFVGEATRTYQFSFCGEAGGGSDFDTTIAIEDGATQLAYDDDSCGLRSRLEWTAPYTGTFTLRVGSFSSAYQGTFWLDYRVSDVIFRNGFDG